MRDAAPHAGTAGLGGLFQRSPVFLAMGLQSACAPPSNRRFESKYIVQTTLSAEH